MRRLMLVLLVLLLPLRLWAADAMGLAAAIDAAGGLAPCHPVAAAAAAGPPPVFGDAHAHAQTDAPNDAHTDAHSFAHTDADAHAAASPDRACLLCGVCHLALGAPAAPGVLPQALPVGPPVPMTASAREAEPQRAVEPPRG